MRYVIKWPEGYDAYYVTESLPDARAAEAAKMRAELMGSHHKVDVLLTQEEFHSNEWRRLTANVYHGAIEEWAE